MWFVAVARYLVLFCCCCCILILSNRLSLFDNALGCAIAACTVEWSVPCQHWILLASTKIREYWLINQFYSVSGNENHQSHDSMHFHSLDFMIFSNLDFMTFCCCYLDHEWQFLWLIPLPTIKLAMVHVCCWSIGNIFPFELYFDLKIDKIEMFSVHITIFH